MALGRKWDGGYTFFRAMAAVSEERKVCKNCGYSYAETDGRQHGRFFLCSQCKNIEQLVRRNLGSTTDLAEWSQTETYEFFRASQKKSNDGRLKWSTIRASWIKKSTEAIIRKFSSTVEKQPLPKSMWLQRGFEAEVVDRFEPKWSDEYGTYVHELPVATLRWEEAHESVEAKVLEQEKNAAKKKGSKGDGDQDLDVPALKAEDGKDDMKARKAQVAEQKKVASGNVKIAAVAARAMGSLCSVETSLTKLLAKTDGMEGLNEASLQVCRDSLEKARRWGAAARAAVNGQEAHKGLSPDAEQAALVPLPFDQSDLKALLLESAAGQKSLKESMPKKAPRPKAAAKAAGSTLRDRDEGQAVEPQPKRRRTKTPA